MTANNRTLAGAFVLAITMAVPLEATIARSVPFDEKVEKAASIIVGKVTRTRSEWDPSHRWILTYSTFQVEETIKGPQVNETTLITPGGTVGSIHQESIGVPAFREGDEHVIFVRGTPNGPTVLDFDQGAYDIEQDGSERVVRPVNSDLVRMDTQSGTVVAPEQPRTLREFRDAVRESERRARVNKMEILERQKRQSASIGSLLGRYRFLIALALAGALLATLHLIRR
jgi:hypothetical protein